MKTLPKRISQNICGFVEDPMGAHGPMAGPKGAKGQRDQRAQRAKGPKGPTGPPGPNGPNRPKGANGTNRTQGTPTGNNKPTGPNRAQRAQRKQHGANWPLGPPQVPMRPPQIRKSFGRFFTTRQGLEKTFYNASCDLVAALKHKQSPNAFKHKRNMHGSKKSGL